MLLFLDGMAHYDTSRLGMKYTTVNTAACTWSVVAEGRFGNCIKRASTSNAGVSGYLDVSPLTTRLGTWTPTSGGVCGFAIKVDDLLGSSPEEIPNTPTNFFVVMEGSHHHVSVALNPTGTFTLRGALATGGSDYILAQSIEGLSNGTWMYIEFKWVISSTVGIFQIRVNGTTVLAFSGDTKSHDFLFAPGSGSIWTTARLLAAKSNVAPYLTMRICDLYLADLATTLADDVHDFLGDGIIDTIIPNGVGAAAAWTPSPGATPNWDTVNDRPVPDDDATYVTALTPGLKDVHHFEDIPVGSQVKGIHVNILTRKEGEGSCSVAPIVHQGSTDYVGPTQGVASPSYDRYVTQAWDLNPATNAKFTDAEVNAGQFGVVKVS